MPIRDRLDRLFVLMSLGIQAVLVVFFALRKWNFQMFYWWPLLKVHRPSWFVFSALYILSTWLNLSSH
jgi:hypothetical protein